MNEWFIFACFPFAVWRLTALIQEDRIMQPLRNLMGEQTEIVETVYAGQTLKSEVTTHKDTFFGHLIECFRCVSVWASLGLLLPYIFIPEQWQYMIILLGLSGWTVLVQEKVK